MLTIESSGKLAYELEYMRKRQKEIADALGDEQSAAQATAEKTESKDAKVNIVSCTFSEDKRIVGAIVPPGFVVYLDNITKKAEEERRRKEEEQERLRAETERMEEEARQRKLAELAEKKKLEVESHQQRMAALGDGAAPEQAPAFMETMPEGGDEAYNWVVKRSVNELKQIIQFKVGAAHSPFLSLRGLFFFNSQHGACRTRIRQYPNDPRG